MIVKFKSPPKGSDQGAQALSDAIAKELPRGRVKKYPRSTGRAVIAFDPKEEVFEVARRLSERPEVAYAEPDVVDSAQLVPSDTRYGEQWSHPGIDSEDAWDLETGAADVLIGIIDSGISMPPAGALDHPDLNAPGRSTSRHRLRRRRRRPATSTATARTSPASPPPKATTPRASPA